jgi:hypothetical protein
LAAFVVAGLAAVSPLRSAELIYQEAFNNDGETNTPPRYTTTGRFKSEFPHDPNIVGSAASQAGPVFWGHNTEVSIVGVFGPTSERRALLVWDGVITADEVSPELWTVLDATFDWLLRGKTNATIVFSVAETAAQSLADRLRAKGHTVVDDDTLVPDSSIQGDLIIKTSNSAEPGRFARVAKPVLTFSATDHDDMLVGLIGTPQTFEAGSATIVTPGHPAAGGLTGSFKVPTNAHNWQMMGDALPNGAITIANFIQYVPATVSSLAELDALVAGTEPSDKSTATVGALDFSDGASGDWFVENPIPGAATGNWGLVATGRVTVAAANVYSFALSMDDGARLRIDKDGNGFSAADDVIVADAVAGFRTSFGDLQLNAGTYGFEVAAFNAGGVGGVEVSVSTLTGGGNTNPISGGSWELLGQTTGAVAVQGDIQATSYVPTSPPDEVTRPFLALLNGPNDTPAGSVYGGGPFTGFEGTGFFGGAALNKFDVDGSGTPKTLTLPPIDVSGKPDLKLTIACAATFLDFETPDAFDILIDTNNSGIFTPLIRFLPPTGADKYLDDRSTNPGNPTRLGLEFKDVTYDLPSGASQITIKIQATTTWFNEIVGFDNIRLTSGPLVTSPPVLTAVRQGADLKVSWGADAAGYVLESSASIGVGASWSVVPGTPNPITGAGSATVGTTLNAQFYRLKQ